MAPEKLNEERPTGIDPRHKRMADLTPLELHNELHSLIADITLAHYTLAEAAKLTNLPKAFLDARLKAHRIEPVVRAKQRGRCRWHYRQLHRLCEEIHRDAQGRL